MQHQVINNFILKPTKCVSQFSEAKNIFKPIERTSPIQYLNKSTKGKRKRRGRPDLARPSQIRAGSSPVG
jgi:hypothetical protein